MSRPVLEKIIAEVTELTSEEKRQLREIIDQAIADDDLARRRLVVQSVRGKYASLGLSSERFAADKTTEIDIEDRRGKL